MQCEMGQAHGVVMNLMQKATLLNKGYDIFTDNLFTKPVLVQVEEVEHFDKVFKMNYLKRRKR